MKCIGHAIAIGFLTLVANSTVAQDGPPSQYDKVKALEPYVAWWQGDFQPPGGPEGTVSGVGRWTSNRSNVQFNWSFTPDSGERMHVLTILMGWNGKTQSLYAWVFSPEGQASGEVVVSDDGLTIATTGMTVGGEEMSSKAVYQLAGDKLTITVSEMKVGGQELPGYSFTTDRRERPRRRP